MLCSKVNFFSLLCSHVCLCKMDRKTLPVERHREFLVSAFYLVLFYSSTGMKQAHSALTDHYKSPGQQGSGSLSKLSVMTLMVGLLLSASSLSVSSLFLLRVCWAAAAEIHHLLLAPSGLRGQWPGLHDARLFNSAQHCEDWWGCRYPASETHSATLARDCWKWFSAAVCWDYRNLCLGCVCWLPQPLQRFPLGLKSTPFTSISQQLRLLQQITLL